MFKLDEEYLKSLGIADLPEDAKKGLVEGLERQIQDRISLKFLEGLTDEQIDEFGKINEGAMSEVKTWLMSVDPQYETDARYVALKNGNELAGDELARQYAQMRWLDRNVPNYGEIIVGTMNEVKEEILAMKEGTVEK